MAFAWPLFARARLASSCLAEDLELGLALVLAIGLIVDDAIVVLENIYRRMEELGETPLVAAYNGTRQVGFAVVATTLVLMAVFIPITFMGGTTGRLFTEFAIAIAALNARYLRRFGREERL